MAITWHKIGLNEAEELMLMELSEKRGYRVTEAFRMALRKLYNAEIPPYTKPKTKPHYYDLWTPSRICTDLLGGRVEGKFCVYQKYGVIEQAPLREIKRFI